MPTFTELLKAREDVETASARLRELEALGLDLIAEGYAYPVGGSRGVGAICVPVRQRRARAEDPELRLVAVPWQSNVGIVLVNDLASRHADHFVRFDHYPQAAIPVGSAALIDTDDLLRLLYRHRLDGVVIGVGLPSQEWNTVRERDTLVTLNRLAVEAGVAAIPQREQDDFRVDWSRLPFLQFNERT